MDTDVGKASSLRPRLGLPAWVPAAEGGGTEELGKGDNDCDGWGRCLQSPPVAATKLASLAAISRDKGRFVNGIRVGEGVLAIVIVWLDTTPFHFGEELLHGIMSAFDTLGPVARGRRLDTIDGRIPDLRVVVLCGGLGALGVALDCDGFGMLVLAMMCLGVDFLMLFEILRPFEGLLADITQMRLERGMD